MPTWGVGELGTWGVGELGTWGLGDLTKALAACTWGLGDLGTWGLGDLEKLIVKNLESSLNCATLEKIKHSLMLRVN